METHPVGIDAQVYNWRTCKAKIYLRVFQERKFLAPNVILGDQVNIEWCGSCSVWREA